MFKLEPNPTFFAPVKIHVPGQGDGQIEVEFRYLSPAARKSYFASLAERSNIDALAEIVVGWREIDAPFSRENLESLLDTYPSAAAAIFAVYVAEIHGAAAKN